MSESIYIDIAGITGNIISVTIDASYSQTSTVAVIECDAHSLVLGDSVVIDGGYAGNHVVMFRGYVKKIEYNKPEQTYRITCYDDLVRAVDYLIAADDPQNPLAYYSISTLDLVTDLLSLCGITGVSGTEPGFTWGTNPDGARFNLQTVADAVQFISTVVGYSLYVDQAGVIQFVKRYPYVDTGDVPSFSIKDGAGGTIISCQYIKGIDKTRNKIVVYGKTPLVANASAANPYLVVDQTVVIAHELLDTQEICDGTATINLQILNRLTESYEVEVEGDPELWPRRIGEITESFSGANHRPVFVYRTSHILSEAGYITTLTLIP